MESEITKILIGAGLSKTEAEVYIANLELGPSAIWDIAKKSNVKRPTCYAVLEEMAKKGLATRSNDGKRDIYKVVSPKQLALIERRKHEKFVNVITRLEGIASKSPSKPKIAFYDGVVGVMEAYNKMLELPEGAEIYTYRPDTKIPDTYKDFIEQYNHVRASRGVKNFVIASDTEENKLLGLRDPLELKQTRFLSAKKFGPAIEVNIFADTIIYISHSETEPFLTMIENSTMAKEEKEKFALLWEKAESNG